MGEEIAVLLEKFGGSLKELAPLLEHLGPVLAPLLAFLLIVAGGLVIGVVFTALLMFSAVKFAAAHATWVVRHENFPRIASIVAVAVPVLAVAKAGGLLLGASTLVSSLMTVVNFHPKLVEIRDKQRAKDLDTTQSSE
jgi:hypothetical protein